VNFWGITAPRLPVKINRAPGHQYVLVLYKENVTTKGMLTQ